MHFNLILKAATIATIVGSVPIERDFKSLAQRHHTESQGDLLPDTVALSIKRDSRSMEQRHHTTAQGDLLPDIIETRGSEGDSQGLAFGFSAERH